MNVLFYVCVFPWVNTPLGDNFANSQVILWRDTEQHSLEKYQKTHFRETERYRNSLQILSNVKVYL